VIGLLVALLACERSPARPPTLTAAPVAVAPAALGAGALVVTDISGSMKGFVQPGSVALSRLHEELVGALSASPAGAPALRTVDEALSPPLPAALERYSTPGLYVGASSRFDKALQLDTAEGPASRRFTVVLTDGVYGGGAGDDAGCAVGATPACVGRALSALVEAGFGVWLVALALPFDGKVYAERAMDAGQFAQVQAGLGPGQSARDFAPSPSAAHFRYRGPRPLLAILVSRDVEGGRALKDELLARWRRLGLSEKLDAAELAPGLTPPSLVTEVGWDPAHRSAGLLLGRGGPSADPSTQKRLGYAQIVECGRTDTGTLRARLSPAPEGLQATVDPGLPVGLVGPIGVGVDLSLPLTCAGLAAGSTTDLRLTLRTQPAPTGLLAGWSAPDTWSQPAGLFGLDAIIAQVSAIAAARRPIDDTLFVRVLRR
jgi:hypothetical protein